MGSLFDSPDPPNPIMTSMAQTGSNIGTGIANAYLGNVNQSTPSGNLNYSVTGSNQWQDPVSGAMYSIPQFTAAQTLSPTGQQTFDASQRAQLQLASLGEEQATRMRNQFASPFSLSGAPAFGDVSKLSGAPQAATTFGDAGRPTAGFGDAGQIGSVFGAAPDVQRSYEHGSDFSADRQRIESGLMERLNPSLAIERNKYEQQLADQGIRYGSPAYENAMRNYSMQATDARLGVIAQGGQEQQRLSEMSRMAGEFGNKAQQQIYEQAKGRGEFGNAAQQQQYEQLFGRGQFYNAAQQQQFGQEAQRGTFYNAGLAQNFGQAQTAFNAANAARQQYLNEQFALRNQPINEISALLTGSQVSQPNFINPNTSTVANTDVAGMINKNFDQQMAVSNQQSATANAIIGGLFGFGGGLARGGYFGGKGG
jgi:hypothetical protein